jgi:predicted phosphate transport protein (TIGR00153 family)
MGIQDVVRWFIPREDHFFVFLERQASTAHLGAQALARFVPGAKIESIQEEVQKHEHAGDAVVHELEEALQKTFVTPIDREDLQRLSSELDDVLDLINSAARTCALFGVEQPTQPMTDLFAILVESSKALETTLPLLRKHDWAGIMKASRVLRQDEKKADAVYRTAISKLFHDESKSAKDILREMTVLEHLEHAVDRCERVAHTLANLAVKHG